MRLNREDFLFVFRHEIPRIVRETATFNIKSAIDVQAGQALAREATMSGKIMTQNITRENLAAYESGLPYDKRIVDKFINSGNEVYEAQVYVMTPEEFDELVDSEVERKLHRLVDSVKERVKRRHKRKDA